MQFSLFHLDGCAAESPQPQYVLLRLLRLLCLLCGPPAPITCLLLNHIRRGLLSATICTAASADNILFIITTYYFSLQQSRQLLLSSTTCTAVSAHAGSAMTFSKPCTRIWFSYEHATFSFSALTCCRIRTFPSAPASKHFAQPMWFHGT